MKLNGTKINLFTFAHKQIKDPVYTWVFPLLCKNKIEEVLKQLTCALVYS